MLNFPVKNSGETKIVLATVALVLVLISAGWLCYSTTNDLAKIEKEMPLTQEVVTTLESGLTMLKIILVGCVLAGAIGAAALLMALRDLRLQSQAQLEIKKSQVLLESVLDHTPAVVFIKDLAGRFLFVNRRFTEIACCSREEILGKTVLDIFKTEMAQTSDQQFQTIIKTGNPIELEESVLCPDGCLRPYFSVKFPVRDTEGKICAVAGIARDITERKQIERLQLQFQTLFESAPGLYVVLKPDLTITAASDAYLKATMTKREAILGHGIFDVFPDNPDDPEADGVSSLRESFNRVLQNKASDTMAIQKYDIRRPDGVFVERFWSPINSPILGADGQVEFIIHRVEDVTEFVLQNRRKSLTTQPNRADVVKRLEQMEAEVFQSTRQLKAANEQLRAANEELEAFSYSVSHDLRAPLRHIDGFADLLQRQAAAKLDERDRRYLNIIASSARQMGLLIDDLLVFSLMGRTELRCIRVSSDSLLKEAVNAAQNEANGRQITWKMAALPEVEADPAMLRQVWTNLIHNAVKYTRNRNPASIEVGCNDGPDNEWIFFVRDNGVGFDMEYAHKLFGVFQRLHRSDEFEGTGIGLANVRRIISRHGGRTWAQAKPDGGATFYFSLPKTNRQAKVLTHREDNYDPIKTRPAGRGQRT
jgi:PAS domain S-box-containing protein